VGAGARVEAGKHIRKSLLVIRLQLSAVDKNWSHFSSVLEPEVAGF
jgi:hypothetical protein